MKSIQDSVAKIIADVRQRGDRALEYYVRKFDGDRLSASRFEVPRSRLKGAFVKLEPGIRSALQCACRRIRAFHRAEKSRLARNWAITIEGVRVGQKFDPLDSAGVYVPGGRYAYPSTVLMTAIPAKVAGVRKVVMVTPLKNLKDEILASAYLAGVDRLFCVGGPAAVAALAYGTKTIPKVDKIAGPGNKFVTEAKRQLYGIVGIDGLAGPSEIAVWADRSTDPQKIALNLMAQAEHDPDSRAYLYAADARVLNEARRRVERRFLPQVRFFQMKRDSDIADAINNLAPEHLILALRNPEARIKNIRTAGAVFLGDQSPVPLGDYSAGPSHVLPTGQAGRYGSGLSVKDFIRSSSTIQTVSPRSRRAFEAGRRIAEAEGLTYHAKALEVR